jgi:hypothetical protein
VNDFLLNAGIDSRIGILYHNAVSLSAQIIGNNADMIIERSREKERLTLFGLKNKAV